MTRTRRRNRSTPRLAAPVLVVLLTAAGPAAALPPGPVAPGPAPPPLATSAVPTPGTGSQDPVGTWPLRPDPEVVRDFDPPSQPWGAGHRGVDLLGSPGQGVRSALGGTVTHAGTLAGRGVVVVSHGATRTTYEPVEVEVRPGDEVAAGDRLGTLQAGPSHCAPRSCLHWGWLEGATYLDPLRLVGLGPVRLLPFLGSTSQGATSTAFPASAPATVPVTAPGPLAVPAPPVPGWW